MQSIYTHLRNLKIYLSFTLFVGEYNICVQRLRIEGGN
jgi:hypothetical protein